ncbi:SAM-dependent methyltransferase [Paracandidimonas soli]|uniref:SAM-dependent methyltransferase n=1 Tax=Paracandidimonas soli TaxID=1917182 RepID=UPI000AD55ACC
MMLLTPGASRRRSSFAAGPPLGKKRPLGGKQAGASLRSVGAFFAARLAPLMLAAFCGAGSAQTLEFEQSSVKPGGIPFPFLELDVPYVKTADGVVERMLDLAGVNEEDYLIDLGSGDGRIPIAAVRDRKARYGFGVEIVPDLVDKARESAREAGVGDRVRFEVQDLFETDISSATVLTMYLLPDVNMKLRPRILSELAPGTRVVSHAFDMGEWESDESDHRDGASLYLWIVPANIEGEWNVDIDGEPHRLSLRQTFQRLQGTLERNGRELLVEAGAMRGTDVHFLVRDGAEATQYIGRVAGDSIIGLSMDSKHRQWRASRDAGKGVSTGAEGS